MVPPLSLIQAAPDLRRRALLLASVLDQALTHRRRRKLAFGPEAIARVHGYAVLAPWGAGSLGRCLEGLNGRAQALLRR